MVVIKNRREDDLYTSHKIIEELYKLANNSNLTGKNKIVRATTCKLPPSSGGKELSVTSFKQNEWLYDKEPSPLPTLARGLFAYYSDIGQWRILARGYDKFFNIDQVSFTKWDWLVDNTVGPYEVTVKENGCIIFVSARPDKGLLVTSKHSVGITEPSHAATGAKWVTRHLNLRRKSKKELEDTLRSMDVTAVFELCDDEFEEHILPYTGERRGLYLHGLNKNLAEFRTLSSVEVKKFAENWGFHSIECEFKSSINQIHEFTKGPKKVNNRDVEGVVVRCKRTDNNKDLFFKIKYDEPYLMYREFREVTNRILKNKSVKFTYSLTEEYIKWVKKAIQERHHLFDGYSKNHGIIAVRELFLKESSVNND